MSSDRIRRLGLAAVCLLAAALGVAGKRVTGTGAGVAVGQGEDFFGTVFLILAPRIAFLRVAMWKIVAPILGILVAIEVSQLSHAAWLERVRADWLGRRIVGNTFEWADFVAYGLAAWAAVLIDRRLSRAGPGR